MNLSVFGLGYVGCVTAACLAARGHTVWGVDINPDKVATINGGRSPIVEPELETRIREARTGGFLHATTDARAALEGSSITFIAVATPSKANGEIDPGHLLRAADQIAAALADLGIRQTVVIRSSVLPSVFSACADIFARRCGNRVHVCVNPEFLREGTAIKDFESPPYTIIGTEDPAAEQALRELYTGMQAPVIVLPAAEAVMVKYASNAYHALKVTFGNEIGQFCKAHGINGHTVMQVFCKDTSLNISAKYLLPGFAFGGSCLPKDVRALVHAGRTSDVDLPVLAAVLASNTRQIESAAAKILSYRTAKVGLVGLSFKHNTDDLRESPFVELAERLLGKGLDLRIYDPNVSLARLSGANKEFIEHTIPHVSRLLVSDLASLAGHAEVVVVGHGYSGIEALPGLMGPSGRILDFCNIEQLKELGARYDGIAW